MLLATIWCHGFHFCIVIVIVICIVSIEMEADIFVMENSFLQWPYASVLAVLLTH